ncbi:S8 family serine peptidase [Paenibacillus tarimensis]|uniref:S8 family serine peptidase n=1 Tax=Paenibacillus tarimensis TaxID=416012 RepID=UPI001F39A098|nr:S8 family serine peptidase [Paenibacillus tarimensis]MCF2946259.1 S8 family serine peptidase [Paenibacillus tarimensis]
MKKAKIAGLLTAAMLVSLTAQGAGVVAAVKPEGKQLVSQISGQELQLSSKFSLKQTDEKIRLAGENSSIEQASYTLEKISEDRAAAIQNKPAALNFVPASESSKSVTVIVELQSEPLAVHEAQLKQGKMKAASNHKTIIAKEQASFSAAAARVPGAKLKRKYTKVFNGYSITLPANQVDRLTALPGVKAVYPSRTYTVDPMSVEPLMNDSAPHIGAGLYWDSGYDGEGIKVGVIDTGVDYNHPSLKDAYKGGYDFVDDDSDPMETLPDPNDPEAATDHGTHVSGTVLGRGNPENPDGSTGWVRGVAPGADLYAYRVLGPGGSGTTEDVIAAIERSVEDGMDVINLSLGDEINDQFSADSIALNNAVLAGVVTVTSNGNAGPGDATAGTPATSELAISVGASTPPGTVPLAEGTSSLTDSISYDLRVMAYKAGSNYQELKGRDLPLVYAGLGMAEDFEGKDLTGKIAFIKRGEIAFTEKIANAKAAGAVAAIIFNRDDLDGHAGNLLEDSPKYIPTFDMKGSDGRKLLAALEEAGEGTFTLTGFGSYEDPGDEMADFSSRGPSLPEYEIKPDISAPGVSIRSSVPAFDGNYEYAYDYFQGTSMAAPHVAGAAALLLDHDGDLTPNQIKSLMMNTAVKLQDSSKERYSHMVQGAGRLDLGSVLEANAIAMVRETTAAVASEELTEYHTGSISYGVLKKGSEASRTVDVMDISGKGVSYDITTVWYGTAPGSLAASSGQVTVAAGASASFDVNLAIEADMPDGRYEGEVILTETAGERVLRIPVAVYVKETIETPSVVSDIVLTPDAFSPNEDGSVDTTDITFKVNSKNDYVSLDAYDDATSTWLGTVFETDDGLAPGSYKLSDWNGEVVKNGKISALPDDLYVLVPFVNTDGGDVDPVTDELVPFVVDTGAPAATVQDELSEITEDSAVITGQVHSDLLVDIFGDYSGIGAGVMYEHNGEWLQADGTITANGAVTIPVPVYEGDNIYEVYVYDLAGNGMKVPAKVITYTAAANPNPSGAAVTVKTPESDVTAGDPFTVEVEFAKLTDLYSAQFSLTYDTALTKGTVKPSVTMATYLEQANPGASLIFDEKLVDLGNGKHRADYILSMVGDVSGFTGSGTLAEFNFSAAAEGSYDFKLSDVRFLGSEGQDIQPGTITGGSVTVIEKPAGPGPGEHIISGSIRAEAFGDEVSYDDVWYKGEDGKLQVVVEALDASGKVVKMGTVKADGTYAISVPAGAYTIRVVVPGHISKSETVKVDGAKSVSFGPLTAGDVNNDAVIDLADLNQAARAFGKSAPWSSKSVGQTDINRDGAVNILDISYILKNYGGNE